MLAEQPGVIAASHGPDSAQAAVIVERVQTVKRKGGGQTAKKVRQSWTVPLSAAPTLDATLLLPRPNTRGQSPDSLWFAMPLGIIRIAAVSADAECRRDGGWHLRLSSSDTRLVSRGSGAESIEETTVSADGVAVGRLRARWRRLPNSWILVSQEFESSDGSYRDVTTLRHFDSRGSADRLDVSDAACAASRANAASRQQSLSDGLFDLHGASPLTTGQRIPSRFSMGLSATSCDVPTDGEVEAGPCLPEALVLAGASTTMIYATFQAISKCLLPEKVMIVECASALERLNAATIAVTVATLAYRRCKEVAQQPPEGCSCNAARVGRTDTPVSDTVALTTVDTIAAPVADCLPGEGGGTGSGGGGSDPVWYQIMICTFEDHYDEFGNYLYSVNKGCSYQLAMM